jgi:hypothetical protein
MINYEGAAGVKVISDAASSTLIIERAQSVHSGNYSCVPYNVNPSSVIVHILNGKKNKIPSRHRLSQPTLVRKVFLHVVHCTRLLSSSLSLSTAVATPISRVLRLIFVPDSRIVPRSFLVFFLHQLLDLRSLLSLGFLPSFPLFFFFFSTYYITPTARNCAGSLNLTTSTLDQAKNFKNLLLQHTRPLQKTFASEFFGFWVSPSTSTTPMSRRKALKAS